MEKNDNNVLKRIAVLELHNRENAFSHHSAEWEEMYHSLFLSSSDEAAARLYESFQLERFGQLSSDPLRNTQYLFVSAVSVISRWAIQAGADSETAFNASDLFIRDADTCKTQQEIGALYKDMVHFYRSLLNSGTEKQAYSKAIRMCIDYINHNLHDRITLGACAELVGYNASYLSTLFKQETGMSFSAFIRSSRVRAASDMLRYFTLPLTEIAALLGFSSYNHFSDTFKRETGQTPAAYRRMHGLSNLTQR